MCNKNCIEFGKNNLRKEEIENKRVLEIGSLDINGSLRNFIETLKPAEYIGVDKQKGKGVDVICDVNELITTFGKESFDVVIATEILEHIAFWTLAISNIKNVCKPNGIILITTRSKGFPYHGYPDDFWRYEVDDMKKIFSDCEVMTIEKDEAIGVFVKAKKPKDFAENNLENFKLYNINSKFKV